MDVKDSNNVDKYKDLEALTDEDISAIVGGQSGNTDLNSIVINPATIEIY